MEDQEGILENMVFAGCVSENTPTEVKYLELERRVGNMANINYPAGDFLIQIKNALMAGKRTISVKNTKFIENIAQAMKKEGFLEDVSISDKMLSVKMKTAKKRPLIIDIKLVSKPGMRVYIKAEELEKQNKPFIYLLSTPKGVIFSKEAVQKRVGGEIIAKIW